MKTEAIEQMRGLVVLRLRRGFTLVELLVVIAIIAILASLLLPTLNRARLHALATQCRERPRELTLAWLMYAEDYNGRVVPNQAGSLDSWVGGIMSFDDSSSDVTNSQKLIDPAWSKLGPYIRSAQNFKCPSDQSQVVIGRASFPR